MTLREAIVEKAREYIGTPYSKLDCSAFARAVYRDFGYELPRVSATQANTIYNMGLAEEIEKGETVASILPRLKPGDLIWWGNPAYPWRWLQIHHVGIYTGDGYNIESAGAGVQERALWETSKWQIVMIADITSLLTYESEVGEVINKDSAIKTIARAQQALITIGFGGDMNPKYIGQWGSKTEAAVKLFQNFAELPQTGVIDADTAGALFDALGNFYNTDIASLEATVNNDKIALRDIAERANSRL